MNNTNFSALAEGLDVRGSNLTELAETLICNNSNPWCRLFFEPNVSVVCSSLEFACRTSPLCRRISDYSCKDLLDCNCPPLTGDSDIAGTGAITGFLVTVGITILVSIADFLFSPPKSDAFNPINRFLMKGLEKFQAKFQQLDRISHACTVTSQVGSDTLLVMGVAVMISLMAQYSGNPGITAYHFEIALTLGWSVSSNSLRIPVTKVSKATLEKKKKEWRSLAQTWRVICALMVSASIIWGYSVSASKFWYDYYACPTKCFPHSVSSWDGEQKSWAIASIVLLVYSMFLALIQLYPALGSIWINRRTFIISRDEHFRQKIEGVLYVQAPYNVLRFIFAWMWFILASKFTNAIAIPIVWYTMAITSIAQILRKGHSQMVLEEIEKETRWGFGQVIPIVMLSFPILTAYETYHYWVPSVSSHNSGSELSTEAMDTNYLLQNLNGADSSHTNDAENTADDQSVIGVTFQHQAQDMTNSIHSIDGRDQAFSEGTELVDSRSLSARNTWTADKVV